MGRIGARSRLTKRYSGPSSLILFRLNPRGNIFLSIVSKVHDALMKKFLLFLFLLGSSLTVRPTFAADPPPLKDPAVTALKDQAVAVLKKGDTKRTTELAIQLLKAKAPASKPLAKRDGDAIHDGYQLLGLAALEEKRMDDAKRYLLEAAKTPGSTTLELFGPNMRLAQDLLDLGEKDIVLEYLNLVSKFWGNLPEEHRKELAKKNPKLLNNIEYMNQENLEYLDKWKDLIRRGDKPRLNRNREY